MKIRVLSIIVVTFAFALLFGVSYYFFQVLQATLSNENASLIDASVLAETDQIDDYLITFNYDSLFLRPATFEQSITAPNIVYSVYPGRGIAVTGDPQDPTIVNTGVLSIGGLRGDISFIAGSNVSISDEEGGIRISSSFTDTDTKLSESDVEGYVFGGEGFFTALRLGDILLSAPGTSSTGSGASLVGVYSGSFLTISGGNLQQVLESIDSQLASGGHDMVSLFGTLDYLSISGQQITLNQIDLATDVIGILPIVNGGTGATTDVNARANLGLVIGSDVQAYDADLTAIGNLSHADGTIIVGNGTTWVAETGSTARTSLGLGTGDAVQFTSLNLGGTGATVTEILDEDDLASDSDTALATQQSIRTYVNSAIGGSALTYTNGLQQSGSNVLLGGQLTQNTRLYDGSNEYLFFNTSNGNVSIGTTIATNYKLNVSGTLNAQVVLQNGNQVCDLSNNCVGQGGGGAIGGSGSAGYLATFTDSYNIGSSSALYEGSGNVGLGTTSVGTYRLNVAGSLNTTALYIAGSQVTASAAQINILNGLTASQSELNLLTGRSGTLIDSNNASTQLSGWDQDVNDDIIGSGTGSSGNGYIVRWNGVRNITNASIY